MITVTGGTGFIGSYILYYLLQENRTVRAIHRKNANFNHIKFVFKALQEIDAYSEPWENTFNRIEWVEADILDTNALEEAFEGSEIVYHAAAIVSFNRKKRDETLRNNIEGTANMVNICLEKGIKKLAYVSSVAAVARKSGEKVDENAKIEDMKFSSAYSESKFKAEMEVWRGIAEGLDAVMINPGIVLGWGNFFNGSPALFNKAAKGLSFYPTGINGYVDVRDVAKALIQLANKPETYKNRYIAVAENVSYKDLFTQISNCLGVNPPKYEAGKNMSKMAWLASEFLSLFTRKEVYITRDVAHIACQKYEYSSAKLVSTLDYKFIPFEKTIADTCKAYKIWAKENL
ncbi:MAG: NAD-dependent epimerase/dehydratase family protein [Sphingobacteriales bacterium]|nr:MAG: NAD-dependent epimerase/dehydratase family protein [Sphingobacteriales bacterium]